MQIVHLNIRVNHHDAIECTIVKRWNIVRVSNIIHAVIKGLSGRYFTVHVRDLTCIIDAFRRTICRVRR
jgi:hypothetical protein